MLIAIGINWEGQRQVLGVKLANRESQSTWRDFLLALKQHGLNGVEVAVSDDHAGRRKAIAEILPEAAWQRHAPMTRSPLAFAATAKATS